VTDIRSFKRTAKVTLYRTSTPLFDEEFLVERKSGDNGIEITDLRIEFDVKRDLSKHPNSCSIKITNLGKTARTALSKKPLSVVLEAGYDGVTRVLFTGDMIFGASTLDGSDWTTLIQCGDGDRVNASARINRSYDSGTPVKDILKDIAKSMGQVLPSSVLNARDLDTQVQGYAAFGSSTDQLSRLLTPHGYTHSIQNGKLQILKVVETTGGTRDEYLLDEAAGIIGSPEFGSPPRNGKAPHVTVNMLLYPELRPGARARVRSLAIPDSSFKIESVSHKGDTHGQPWTTSCELKPI
jgi:hypothetical protein